MGIRTQIRRPKRHRGSLDLDLETDQVPKFRCQAPAREYGTGFAGRPKRQRGNLDRDPDLDTVPELDPSPQAPSANRQRVNLDPHPNPVSDPESRS